MKKILNHVGNFMIALFCVLVIHNITLKPKYDQVFSVFNDIWCFVMLSAQRT